MLPLRPVGRRCHHSIGGRNAYHGHMIATAVDVERRREVCERYGVASLEVFGSVARAEDHEGSDLDLLYVLSPRLDSDSPCSGWRMN